MNPNKWEEIIYLIEEKFGLDNHHQEDFMVEETHDGRQIMGHREIVDFRGPTGKTRVEKTSQPKIVDKRVLSSKRIGGKAVIDYVYSPDEKSEYIKFYHWDEASNTWLEMKNFI